MPKGIPAVAGDTRLEVAGYIYEFVVDHPYYGTGWVPQHRKSLSEHLGRAIKDGYLVHHRDRVKTNNHWSNLQELTFSAHMSLHRPEYATLSGRNRSMETKLRISAGHLRNRPTVEITTLYGAGVPLYEVSDLLGIGRPTVKRTLLDNGIMLRQTSLDRRPVIKSAEELSEISRKIWEGRRKSGKIRVTEFSEEHRRQQGLRAKEVWDREKAAGQARSREFITAEYRENQRQNAIKMWARRRAEKAQQEK